MPVHPLDEIKIVPARLHLKKIKNLFVLKLHVSLLMIIGVCPLKQDSTKSKLYAYFVLGTISTITVVSGFNRFANFSKDHVQIEFFLGITTTIVLFILFVSILFSNMERRHFWQNIFDELLKFDHDLSTCAVAENYNYKLTVLKFVLINLSPLLYSIIDSILWTRADARRASLDVTLYISQHTGLYYELVICNFFWELACVLHSRYQYVQEYLGQSIPHEIMEQHISKYIFEDGLHHVKRKYRLLHKIVQDINALCGWIILMFQIHVTVICLFIIYYVLYIFDTTIENSLQGILLSASVLVSSGKCMLS